MTSMPQCCKFCGAFQDKVYSISGKDKRFPALFKAWRYRKQDAKQYERWKGIVGKENMPKDLDSFQKIKYNQSKALEVLEFNVFQENVRKLLNTERYPLVLHNDAQGKHIKTHKNYQASKSPSYLIESKENEITQELLKLCGTGEMQRTAKTKEWACKELLEAEFIVGYVKDKNGEWVKTKRQ